MKREKKYLPLIKGIAVDIGTYIGGKLDATDSTDR